MANDQFITQLLQLGVGGIDLKRSIDLVSPLRLARMTNLSRDEEGRLATRPGQRRIAWGSGVYVHTISRLQAALAGGEFIRLVGIDSSLYSGVEGPLTRIATGFSGHPMAFVSGRPPLSGDSWMYVGDGAKMVKVRGSDSLVLPLGLRPPVSAAVALLGSDNTVLIEPCEGANWTNNAGTGGTPSNALNSDARQGAYSVAFTSVVGTDSGAYYNFWGKAPVNAPIDASELEGITGIVDTVDDDQLHIWVKIDKPSYVDEFRLYLVVSNDFDPTILPGTSATKNTNAYVKSFIPAQFTPLVEAEQTADEVLDLAVAARQLEEAISAAVARTGGAQIAAEQHDESRLAAQARLALGRGQWTEFGSVGIPLRRGEFLRIGSDTTRGWDSVTGLIFYAKMNTAQPVVIQLDDIYFRGGFELDSSEPTSVGYDYRYRHYDPRTGAKSRWSPVMESKIDAVRQSVRVFPEAYGDSAIRQEFSRRGGTLPSNWYYVGRNHADGQCGKDNTRDSVAVATGIEDDTQFHQPVTTVDKDGKAIYAQPLPVIFGPVLGILFGLGDPYRPGHIYWTATDEYDHWPLYNNSEACSPDEELMNGGVFGGQAFAFSRSRMFGLLVSVVDGKVTAQPSACAKGLAGRWGLAVGLDGIYFAAPDGVWKTTGGTPQNLTDDYISSLFTGQRKNGYAPIDFGAHQAIRLAIHLNELWFGFQDIDGRRQWWVYSLIFQFWRHYEFGWPVAAVESEEFNPPQLLLAGATNGRVYIHDGTADDGLAIASRLRTGALHQGLPRQLKLWGDVELEANLVGVVATVTTYADLESRLIATRTVPPAVGPTVYLIDAFGSVPLSAKDVSLEVAWSALGTRPWAGRGGPSYVPQPESSLGQITEWDALSSPSNKLVKGLLIEADTFGYEKDLQVMVDGSSTASRSFTIQTAGRQFKYVTFEQLEARNVRLVPSDNAPWIPYEIRWLFDIDPLELVLWETQPTDHGIPLADQTLLYAFITMRSSGTVLLTVTATGMNGTVQEGSVVIPSTAGVKQKVYVKLPALKSSLFRYRFESTSALLPHRLFREESVVYVQPWGAEAPIPVQPFGTDDLDVGRVVRDAEGGALRSARWLDTSARAGQT